MSQDQLEIQLVAAIIAVACSLPGVLLVLRRMSLMSDAISHSILLGIVVGVLATGGLDSPLPILAAAASGILMVVLVEALVRSRLVREDAAIGLIFPVLFSLGVILVSRYAGDMHLDVDAVLLGELAFTPFDRVYWHGVDCGPRALWVGTGILGLNLFFISLCYKELKLSTFDAGLAATMGFMPFLLHYLLLSLVSVTCVGAFDAVGSILVVALMIAPPATAHLLTDRMGVMFALSAAIGVAAALGGYWFAYFADLSIAGAIACCCGLLFLLAFLFAPHRGVLAQGRLRRKRRLSLACDLLLIHLLQHRGRPEEWRETRILHLQEHLGWSPEFARTILQGAESKGFILLEQDTLVLCETGKTRAEEALVLL